MGTGSFVDTNVFIYAAAGANDNSQKWEIAHDLLRSPDLCVSSQILAEFYVNCVRKTELSNAEIDDWMSYLSKLTCAPIDNASVLEGIILSRRYQISYWDAAIIIAAHRLGSNTLISEDLNDGQTYGTVRAVNPFLEI